MRRLLTLTPQNPQTGQKWTDNDGFWNIVYTLGEFDGRYWHYTEQKTALNDGSEYSYPNRILDIALRNNIKNDEPRPELTAFDLENIVRDLHFEAQATKIDSAPVSPMPRLEYDWQCLDCGHVWRGGKKCPACGANENEILDWTGI